MDFEEDFPSLKGHCTLFSVDTAIIETIQLSTITLSRCCRDNQRIREAIEPEHYYLDGKHMSICPACRIIEKLGLKDN